MHRLARAPISFSAAVLAALLSVAPASGQSASQPASQPAASQPAASQPAASQPAATQPAASQPAATQPAATQPASRPATPALPAGIDGGPLDQWYAANTDKVALNPGAAAADLSFGVNLLSWIVERDDKAWKRMATVVERAYADVELKLAPPFARPDEEAAGRYHVAAAPLSGRPRDQRDPELEDRLYGKALLLNPGDADLYNHMAIAASLRKDWAAAERWAKLAIAIDPSFLAAYQEMAYVLKNTERYAECIAIADRGVDVDGDLHTKALLLARKGQAYWMLENEDEAMKAFKTSRRLGGPQWVQSYLDGEQTLGAAFVVKGH